MEASAVTSSSANATADSQKAFRGTDFLKIMLSEITNQSPFDPQDTSKLVENMTKLQDLANANYQQYRNDIRWAQDLVSKAVSATQFTGTQEEADRLREQGLRIDQGYASITGRVSGFRVFNETVYVDIDGRDYPLGNVKQVLPAQPDTSGKLAEVAARMLGTQVGWTDPATGSLAQGIVSQVDDGGEAGILLTIGDQQIPFTSITRIGLGR
jgi:hypothetical protein